MHQMGSHQMGKMGEKPFLMGQKMGFGVG